MMWILLRISQKSSTYVFLFKIICEALSHQCARAYHTKYLVSIKI